MGGEERKGKGGIGGGDGRGRKEEKGRLGKENEEVKRKVEK